MKKFILLLSIAFFACNSSTIETGEEYQVLLVNYQADDLLVNIQQKISQAFVASITSQEDAKLISLNSELKNLYKKKPEQLILYWSAYLQFYHSIFYLQNKDNENAEKVIDDAINIMENLPKMNSEDLALLSMLRGFSIQFKAGMKAPFIGGKAAKDAEKAVALENKNLRAWYVSASNDFYTPEQFGGGKVTEEYLKKAIACSDQTIQNNYLPSWGRAEAYEMLIKLYMRKKNWEAAKTNFQKANELFPNNYQINQLAAKLVGK